MRDLAKLKGEEINLIHRLMTAMYREPSKLDAILERYNYVTDTIDVEERVRGMVKEEPKMRTENEYTIEELRSRVCTKQNHTIIWWMLALYGTSAAIIAFWPTLRERPAELESLMKMIPKELFAMLAAFSYCSVGIVLLASASLRTINQVQALIKVGADEQRERLVGARLLKREVAHERPHVERVV